MPPYNNYQMTPPQMPLPQQPLGYNHNTGYKSNEYSIPMKKLMHIVMGLANMQ